MSARRTGGTDGAIAFPPQLFVNNWHVTMNGFILASSPIAALYFILFYLLVVIFILNMFVAFVLTSFLSGGDDDEYVDTILRRARRRIQELYAAGAPPGPGPGPGLGPKPEAARRCPIEVALNERALAAVSKEHLRTAERAAETRKELDAWYAAGRSGSTTVRPGPPPPVGLDDGRGDGDPDAAAGTPRASGSDAQAGRDELFPAAHSDPIGGLEL